MKNEKFATLEIIVIWRMQYFLEHCLNTRVCEFDNFNIGPINAIQKKFVQLHEMGELILSLLLFTFLQ